MRMLRTSLTFLVALGAAGCASGGSSTDPAPPPDTGAAAQPAPSAPAPTSAASTGGGSFTAEQADRGRDTFRSLCTECHYSGEFSDAQFKFKWSRRSAENLYDIIFTQMPESAPGSLSPDEAVSLVAYILRLNGFEAGAEPLPPDPAVLGAISLAPIRN